MQKQTHLGSVVIDHSLVGEITLVAHQQFVDVLAGIAVDFLEPLLHIGEGDLVCDVIDNNNAMSSTVVAASDGSEAFLASCVPLHKESTHVSS